MTRKKKLQRLYRIIRRAKTGTATPLINLASECGFSEVETLSCLVELELGGHVRQLPGRLFTVENKTTRKILGIQL